MSAKEEFSAERNKEIESRTIIKGNDRRNYITANYTHRVILQSGTLGKIMYIYSK